VALLGPSLAFLADLPLRAEPCGGLWLALLEATEAWHSGSGSGQALAEAYAAFEGCLEVRFSEPSDPTGGTLLWTLLPLFRIPQLRPTPFPPLPLSRLGSALYLGSALELDWAVRLEANRLWQDQRGREEELRTLGLELETAQRELGVAARSMRSLNPTPVQPGRPRTGQPPRRSLSSKNPKRAPSVMALEIWRLCRASADGPEAADAGKLMVSMEQGEPLKEGCAQLVEGTLLQRPEVLVLYGGRWRPLSEVQELRTEARTEALRSLRLDPERLRPNRWPSTEELLENQRIIRANLVASA
jgi:hypothetical protein